MFKKSITDPFIDSNGQPRIVLNFDGKDFAIVITEEFLEDHAGLTDMSLQSIREAISTRYSKISSIIEKKLSQGIPKEKIIVISKDGDTNAY